MTCIDINHWNSPATAYPRDRVGSARIATSWYSPGVYHLHRAREIDYYIASKRLYITTLKIDGKTWMVDDPPHWWWMQMHAEEFEGHVVCAGLGLGLMIHALHENPKIKRITVIERSQDVIDLVGPLVTSDKSEIIKSDWHEFDPESIAPADGVLFDLFVGSGRELLTSGFREAADIYRRWNNFEMTVRVHGLPNPLVGEVGLAIAISERKMVSR